jgi:hypothetical protein
VEFFFFSLLCVCEGFVLFYFVLYNREGSTSKRSLGSNF